MKKKAKLRTLLASGGLLTLFTLFACNALIGTRDLTYDAADGGEPDGGGTDGSSDNRDAAVLNDGSPDAVATCLNADLTTDGKNCGRCAHDCMGGECIASKCQPKQLFSGTVSPYGLAIDSTNLYFTDITGPTGGVYQMAKDAVAPATARKIADTPDPLVYDIVADDDGIYFSWGSSNSGSLGALETVLPDGGGRRALMMDASIPRGLSLSKVSLFFALTYLTPEEVGSVARSAKNATATILSNNEPGTDNTFVSGSNLYWGGESKPEVRFCTTTTGGCAATLKNFATGLNASEALGANTKNVFVSGTDLLYQIEKGTGAFDVGGVAQGQPQVYSIAADDTDIYWLDLGTPGNTFKDGSVRHCAIDGSGAVQCAVPNGEIILKSELNPRVIVMDAKAVYWTVQSEGAVYRLAR